MGDDICRVKFTFLNLLQYQIYISGGRALAHFQGDILGKKVSKREIIIFIAIDAYQGYGSRFSDTLGSCFYG